VANVVRLDDGFYCLDLRFQGMPGVIAAFLVEDAGEYALIETGPSTTIEVVLAGLDEIGVDPERIGKVVVTHIHLDHAGAAGSLLRRWPGAQLYVHERGVRHLADPERLIASATQIYGDLMETLWGPIEPVPRERMTAVGEGDAITVGRRRFDVLYTPGHASHHVAFWEDKRDILIAGDAAAVRLRGHRFVRPPTPPPDIDLELWSSTLVRLAGLGARMVCLTHFGAFADVDRHLRDAWTRLFEWGDVVRQAAANGKEQPDLTAVLRQHGDEELRRDGGDAATLAGYELATPYGMSVDGYLRYYRKRGMLA
jgi:glyoxylase-like metal-dependent hydrolase (beta-lactamase superfamily II)